MKRGTFIFIFIAFILVISGAAFNSNQNITPFGCGTTSSGGGNSGRDSSPDCIFTDRNLPEDNVLTYFAPAEVLAIELTAASMGIDDFPLIPASFKVQISGANPPFVFREGSTPPRTTSHPIASTQRDCTLFTFTNRIQFSGVYTAKKDPQEIDPVTGKKKCYYKVIAGSDLIQGFTDCPEVDPNQLVESCADTKQCSYHFDKTYTYGYIVIADKEGCNPLVTPVTISDSQDAIEQAIIEAAQICRSVESAVPESECGNSEIDAGEECDDGNTIGNDGCDSQCNFECIVQTGPNKHVRCRYEHQDGRSLDEEVNLNVIEICNPLIFNQIKEWVLLDSVLSEQVKNGKFDGAVRKVWEKIHDDFYLHPIQTSNSCPSDVRYCTEYRCQNIKPSQIMSGEAPCALCVEWANVYFSYLRTLGVPQERITILELLAASGVIGEGHGVVVYKSDQGNSWILDGTCDKGKLYTNLMDYATGIDGINTATDEELERILEKSQRGEIDLVNRCAPMYIYSFNDDKSIRKANLDEFPDLIETGAVEGVTPIDYEELNKQLSKLA